MPAPAVKKLVIEIAECLHGVMEPITILNLIRLAKDVEVTPTLINKIQVLVNMAVRQSLAIKCHNRFYLSTLTDDIIPGLNNAPVGSVEYFCELSTKIANLCKLVLPLELIEESDSQSSSESSDESTVIDISNELYESEKSEDYDELDDKTEFAEFSEGTEVGKFTEDTGEEDDEKELDDEEEEEGEEEEIEEVDEEGGEEEEDDLYGLLKTSSSDSFYSSGSDTEYFSS